MVFQRRDDDHEVSGSVAGSPAPADQHTAVSIEIRTGSVAGIRSMRRELGHHLERAGWPEVRILDAQLVLAELATNAFIHDAASEFLARVAMEGASVRITTSHMGTDTPPPAPVVPAPAPTPDGRGLAIVDRLVSDRLVQSEGGLTTTTIRLDR